MLGPDTNRRDKSVETDQVFEPGCQRTILSGTNAISCCRSRVVDPLPGFPDLHLHLHSLDVFVRLTRRSERKIELDPATDAGVTQAYLVPRSMRRMRNDAR